jgi:hypothetical protein
MTGARPAQFNICQQLMSRQTYTGKVAWVIVDDAIPVSTDCVTSDFRGWDIVKVYPKPSWTVGKNTQARNLRAGLKAMTDNYSKEEIEAIFIIEDDDYYRTIYLERMMAHFNGYDLVGEMKTIYYNVQWRRYVTNNNTAHASLFQTAFKYCTIPILQECMVHKFFDYVFWSKVTNKFLFYENDLAVGMKGMPGRGGIGAGHSKAMSMHDDTSMRYLAKLIGEDFKLYESFYTGYRQPINYINYNNDHRNYRLLKHRGLN